MNKWRIATNKWNLECSPWDGAFGIEEDDDSAHVPALVCWFYRGYDRVTVQRVVDAHNKDITTCG
jgi:hypothetical protein